MRRNSIEMWMMSALIAGGIRRLVLVSVLLISSGISLAQESVANLVKRSADAVVLIVTSDSNGQETALGSGFFVSADGEIVTNFHVIEGAHSAVVKVPSGAFFPVSGVLASDPDGDLAIIKVSGNNLPFLNLAVANKLSVGDHVVAIGSPLGLEETVSDGVVSAFRVEAQDKRRIHTTAPVSPGNSGGPLLDMRGVVVGVITRRGGSQEGENLNFAIPSDEVESLLSKPYRLVALDSFGKDRQSSVADSDQAPVNQGGSREKAIEQRRAIAKAIEKCPDSETMSTDQRGYTTGVHYSAPMDVIWDIERSQSYRSPEAGYIEFVEDRSFIPSIMKDCQKRDAECNRQNEVHAAVNRDLIAVRWPPQRYRYEFDFGSHGLEFSRALWKNEGDDASHWAAMGLEDRCEGRAVRTVIPE